MVQLPQVTKQKANKPTIRMSSVNQQMSLFVPRVFKNITAERIKVSMEGFGLGQVERVDLVTKEGYNAAYIHFKSWNNNSFVSQFQERAADPEQKCTLEYDSPWYWIVLENTSAKRVGSERRKEVVNLRPSFIPVAPGLPQEDKEMDNKEMDNNEMDNKEMIEDIIWDMQEMQGEINDLHFYCQKSGYQIPYKAFDYCNDEDEDESVLDFLKKQIKNMQEEIHDLQTVILVRDAVTGNTFLRDNQQITDCTDYGICHKPNNGGITRDVANCMRTDLYNSVITNDIPQEFWDEWDTIEVPSKDIPGMFNQMYKNKISGEIADLCNLLKRGAEKARNNAGEIADLNEMMENYINAAKCECL